MNNAIKNDRRSVNERRGDRLTEPKNMIDRRKKPERRLSGIDVEELNMSEEDFLEHFSRIENTD